MLAACSGGGGHTSDGPSLVADELWERMEAERARPFPVMDADEFEEVVETEPLSADERRTLEKDLKNADADFRRLEKDIQGQLKDLENIQADKEAKQSDRDIIWRGLQLELSRLHILRRDVALIVARLKTTGDNDLLDNIKSLIRRTIKKLENEN